MAKSETGYGKFAAAGATGALTTIVVNVADHMGYKLTPDVITAIQTVLTAAAVWVTPHQLRRGHEKPHPKPKHHEPAHHKPAHGH